MYLEFFRRSNFITRIFFINSVPFRALHILIAITCKSKNEDKVPQLYRGGMEQMKSEMVRVLAFCTSTTQLQRYHKRTRMCLLQLMSRQLVAWTETRGKAFGSKD
ncbi:hypothetical protein PoB_004976700 [Plakobranchus ocellatus]|uniref:Uncharacterized protein n=1 Tax=Plakobranchus ocellatus TaxID=259542 RepID=A0AAV4BVA1_9GAST|nr:hypothetical protein PoB_004976700 [Plakobranchus ocellatus]